MKVSEAERLLDRVINQLEQDGRADEELIIQLINDSKEKPSLFRTIRCKLKGNKHAYKE